MSEFIKWEDVKNSMNSLTEEEKREIDLMPDITSQIIEQKYEKLVELEEKEEAGILIERLTRLEQNPRLAIPWEIARRSGK